MFDLYARCDMHVHTTFSPCGHDDMEPAAILAMAKRRGLRHLGITDHLHAKTDLDNLLKVRDSFASSDSLSVYFGCEADVDGIGLVTIPPDLVPHFDFVMMAHTHFQHGYGVQPVSYEPDVVADYMLELFIYAVQLDFTDVIAHPFMIPPYERYSVRSQHMLTDSRLAPALELARERNVAMEISRRALVEDQQEFYIRFYKLCKRMGLKFTFGTDAHSLPFLGMTALLEPIVRAVGITDDDIWLPVKRGQ